MFFLLVLVLAVGGSVWSVYRTSSANNCINEKWSMLANSLRDQTFNQNYKYHIDSSDVSLYNDTELRIQ